MPESDEDDVEKLFEIADEYVSKKSTSDAEIEEHIEHVVNGSVGCCLSWLCITVSVSAVWITWGKVAGIWTGLGITTFLWIMHHIAARKARKKT